MVSHFVLLTEIFPACTAWECGWNLSFKICSSPRQGPKHHCSLVGRSGLSDRRLYSSQLFGIDLLHGKSSLWCCGFTSDWLVTWGRGFIHHLHKFCSSSWKVSSLNINYLFLTLYWPCHWSLISNPSHSYSHLYFPSYSMLLKCLSINHFRIKTNWAVY